MIFPQFISWGSIDGVDMFTGFGFAVESGSDSFRALKTPKQGYTFNWPGRSGVQHDLLSPIVYEARVFYLKGWILANSGPEFVANCDALETALKKTGYLVLYCKKWNKTYNCRLKGFPANIETPKGVAFNNTTFYGAEITIEFDEVYI